MTTEEKAKRYDEALTKARNIVNSINVGLVGKDSFEAVFPELKESEDERIRKHLISFFDNLVTFGNASICETEDIKVDNILAWLEKQAESTECKQEWSEEDESIINDIICYIRQRLNYESEKGKKKIQECENWLKSLRPQSQWKPSSDQIFALRAVVNELKCSDNKCQEIIEDLYNDLEKLWEK